MAETQSTFRFAQIKTADENQRPCQSCGELFTPKRESQAACSRSCRSRQQWKNRDSVGSANPNWKGGGATLTCLFCRKEFTVSHARKDKAKYCSLSCWSRDLHNKRPPSTRRKRKPQDRQPDVRISCQWCRVERTVRYIHRRNKFCSNQCQFAWRRSWMILQGNPNWMGGISQLPYPAEWGIVKKAIVKRDGGRCQNPECPATARRVTVHHIDYDKNNCDPANLITVCNGCNSTANFQRERWQAFYSALQESRGIYPRVPGSPVPFVPEKPGRKGTAHPMAKLADGDIREIRRLSAGGMRNRRIAERYGVAESTVCNIVKCKTWSHVN